MSEFTYLFRGRNTFGSPEEMQKHLQKWVTWIKELGEKGYIKQQKDIRWKKHRITRAASFSTSPPSLMITCVVPSRQGVFIPYSMLHFLVVRRTRTVRAVLVLILNYTFR